MNARAGAVTCCGVAALAALSAGGRAQVVGNPAVSLDGLVRVDAIVTSADGVVTGLTKDDFELLSDGHPVPIAYFSAEPAPLSLAILVDVSASQSPGLVWRPQAANAQTGRAPQVPVPQFDLQGVQAWDRVQPGAIGARLYLAAHAAADIGELQRDWKLVFEQPPSRWYEGSAIWDAVGSAVGAMSGAMGRRAIVLVTDGEASGNQIGSHDAATLAVRAGVLVSVVAEEAVSGAGANARPRSGAPGVALAARGIDPTRNLATLADATGGTYAFDERVAHAGNPARLVAQALDGLHHAYTLGFAPASADGTHTIEVRVKRPNVTVYARRSYWTTTNVKPAAGTPASGAGPEAPPALPLLPAGLMDLSHVRTWIAKVAAHTPGRPDDAALTVSRWPVEVLEQTTEDVAELATAIAFLHAREHACEAGHGAGSACGQVELHLRGLTIPPLADLDRLFGLSPAEIRAGHANRVLERGALLHTDVAILASTVRALQGPEAAPGSGARSSAARVADGQVLAIEDTSPQWSAARRLLDAVETNPLRLASLAWTDVVCDPSGEALVRTWYRLASAYDMSQLDWPDAEPTIQRGSDIFPTDPVLLLYRGTMHEIFAGPVLQGAAQALVRANVTQAVQAPRQELEQAEQYLRLAAASEPDLFEARLRLGHVLGLLGRHDEARRELAAVSGTVTDPRLAYLADLLLGGEDEARGDLPAARADFARAAKRYPAAQSPLVAESVLARSAGDAVGAQAPLTHLFATPVTGSADDPWWTYDAPLVGAADAIAGRLRQAFLTEVAR